MTDASLQGAISRAGGMIQGWCWSAARPAERLTVTVLIDGAAQGSVTAARLRSELVRPGLCDGYHGFSLALPPDLPPGARIEASESASGQIFGRIVPARTAEIERWGAQAEAAYAHAVALQEALPALAGRMRWSMLAPALAETGRHFARRPLAAQALPPGLRLAEVASPRFSLLLDAGADLPGTMRGILAVAPLLRRYRAELLLTDDGCGAMSAGWAALPGLGLCLTRAAPGAARLNEAAVQARGDDLVFLRGRSITARGLAELLDAASCGSAVLLGGTAQMNAQRGGFASVFQRVEGEAVRSGLSLLAPRSLFHELGGLDAATEDGADLPMFDFALRAEGFGHAVHGWRELLLQGLELNRAAAQARGHFLTRWGIASA